jgi:uncharacterized RDD family membrane protein YckC
MGYARLNRRIKATLLDLLILTIPVIFMLTKEIPFIAVMFIIVFYFSIFESSGIKGSIGKRILKIKVVKKNGDRIKFSEALLRNILKFFVSFNFLFFGFMMSTFTKYKQSYHDIFVNTIVVRKKEKLNSNYKNSIDRYNASLLFKILTLNLIIISFVSIIGFFVVNLHLIRGISVKNEIQMLFFIFIIIMSTIGFYYRTKWSYWTSLAALSLFGIRLFVLLTENLLNLGIIFQFFVISFEVIVVTTLFFLLKKDIFLKFKFKVLERGKFRKIILILMLFAIIIVFNIS